MPRTNYLYPCKGVTKDGKPVKGDVIAPTAALARKYWSSKHMVDYK